MTVKELRTITGLSQRAFGEKYHIPTRTIEDWEGGRRKPSETILYLLERAVKSDHKKRTRLHLSKRIQDSINIILHVYTVRNEGGIAEETAEGIFDTFKEAREYAEGIWDRLSPKDQEKTEIEIRHYFDYGEGDYELLDW